MRWLSIGGPLLFAFPLWSAHGWSEQAGSSDVRSPVLHRVPASESTLPIGAVVLPASPADFVAIVAAYRTGREANEATFRSTASLVLLSAGPVLDSGDAVSVGSFSRTGSTLELQIAYTSERLQGHPLRRNVPWQPLVDLPLPSMPDAGHYTVGVTWKAVEDLTSAKPLGTSPVRVETSFSIDR